MTTAARPPADRTIFRAIRAPCTILAIGALLSLLARAAAADGPSEEAFGKKEAEVRKVIGAFASGFEVRRVGPFVVVSDLPAAALDRVCKGSIEGCRAALARQFFATAPDRPTAIYLLAEAETYEAFCLHRTGRRPSTPYGFYRREQGEIICDVSTGTGTLVHEMVHALMAPDFPKVPAWMNEGLGSLFEQCGFREGELRGLPNWRLAGLKKTIAAGSLRSLHDLMGLDDDAFYGRDSGVNYAHARYFLLYLQERGELRDFYRAYRDGFADDATGRAALAAATGEGPAAHEKRFRAFVDGLRFP